MMTRTSALDRALESLANKGRSTPCAGPSFRLWTSNDAGDRAVAARLCRECPILDVCHTAAGGEQWHVWGGVDREQESIRRKADQRRVRDRRKAATHCRNGHEWNATNSYIAPNGYHMCRVCRAKANARLRARKTVDA